MVGQWSSIFEYVGEGALCTLLRIGEEQLCHRFHKKDRLALSAKRSKPFWQA